MAKHPCNVSNSECGIAVNDVTNDATKVQTAPVETFSSSKVVSNLSNLQAQKDETCIPGTVVNDAAPCPRNELQRYDCLALPVPPPSEVPASEVPSSAVS